MSHHEWRYRGAADFWSCVRCGKPRIWGYEFDGAVPNDKEYCEGAKKGNELRKNQSATDRSHQPN